MCDICNKPEGEEKTFKTYQPSDRTYEEHKVCKKCVDRLVERYFSKMNVL
jgi:hypothetical protein